MWQAREPSNTGHLLPFRGAPEQRRKRRHANAPRLKTEEVAAGQ
jgi:hypothetical protein